MSKLTKIAMQKAIEQTEVEITALKDELKNPDVRIFDTLYKIHIRRSVNELRRKSITL